MVDYTHPFTWGPLSASGGKGKLGARRPWSDSPSGDGGENGKKNKILYYDSQEQIDTCIERCTLPECRPNTAGCLIRKKGRRAPTDISIEIYKMFESGMTIKDISEKTGTTKGRICGHLKRFGDVVKERNGEEREEMLGKVRVMIDHGYKTKVIAERLGISEDIVRRFKREIKDLNGG